MKVGDLKKGMLLECANDNDAFLIHGSDNLWVAVRPRWTSQNRRRNNPGFIEDKIIMYIGTKKDTNIDMAWCDKFVLIDGKIVGVDPAAWQVMRIFNESR